MRERDPASSAIATGPDQRASLSDLARSTRGPHRTNRMNSRDRSGSVPPEQRRSGRRLGPPRPLVAARLRQSQAVRICREGLSGQSEPQRYLGHALLSELDALPEPPDHLAIFTPAETTMQDPATTAAPPARAAPPSMPRASAKAATRTAAAAARSCARRSQRTGIAVSARTAWASPAAHRNFATVPDESLQQLMPSPVAIVVQSGAMATSINRAINDLGLKTAYLASCGSQFGCTDRRLHRLLRRPAGAARHPLLHRGRARRRAFP